MAFEENQKRKQGKQKLGVQTVIAILVFFLTLLVEVYVMINMPHQYVLLAGIGILSLAAVYFCIVGILNYRAYEEELQQEQYDSLQKTEKASYLMMRKYFTDMDTRLLAVEAKMGIPVEEIISAQKGIAKITISRNKENADAMMNSNDKLMEKIADFAEQLSNLSKDMTQTNQSMLDKVTKEIIIKQQEAISLIKENELSIKNEILNMNLKFSMGQQVMVQQPMMMQQQPQSMMINQQQLQQEQRMQQVSEMNPGILDDFSDLGDFVGDETELLREEEISENPLGEVISFADKNQTHMDPIVEEPAVEEPAVEEPAVEEPVVEEPAVEEQVIEELPPMPDLSDPHKIMSPDEIAALLANMGN